MCFSKVAMQDEHYYPRKRNSTKVAEVLSKNRRGKLEEVGRRKMESQKKPVQIFDGMNLRLELSQVHIQ